MWIDLALTLSWVLSEVKWIDSLFELEEVEGFLIGIVLVLAICEV